MEQIFSGYCRVLDAPRIALVEQEPGSPPESDCQYDSCPYRAECEIGKQILALGASTEQKGHAI